MALDPQLLEILACPEDKGPLLLLRGRGRALQPAAQAALRDPRRHPDDAHRRGRDGRRRRARAALAKAEADGIEPTFDPRERDDGGRARAARLARHVRRRRRACPSRCEAAVAAAADVDGLPDGTTTSSNVVVLGMGGSGIAGDVLAAVAGPFMPVPVVVPRATSCPAFVGDGTLVIAMSFSGDTEETVEAATRPPRAGAPRRRRHRGRRARPTWPTPGAPRSSARRRPSRCPVPASARSPSRRCVVLERIGLFPGATAVDRRGRRPAARAGATSWSPTTTRPSALARASAARIPLVYGGGAVGAVAAQRWKTPGQREREGAGVRRTACPSCATTRSAAGASTATSPARCSRS